MRQHATHHGVHVHAIGLQFSAGFFCGERSINIKGEVQQSLQYNGLACCLGLLVAIRGVYSPAPMAHPSLPPTTAMHALFATRALLFDGGIGTGHVDPSALFLLNLFVHGRKPPAPPCR